jgi:hypothetical protein
MVLADKPEGRRPVGRPRSRRENNIKMNLIRNILGNCGLDSSADMWLM